ncbi:protein of unknown function [Magnetospirillum gryphiswaldense MSR-1 v2]|uniref:Transposase n=1 Tax=Magnetospirillum gryphiswaldense (strain DSM 6361 / JCM 21280 / NBRC 15271 / MSR-1) TaxID=431944 RepID=V6F747_MAGGM|nr:protein of unknown function [Magnetospirillum gryphiswaldense MSR-1 v2]
MMRRQPRFCRGIPLRPHQRKVAIHTLTDIAIHKHSEWHTHHMSSISTNKLQTRNVDVNY